MNKKEDFEIIVNRGETVVGVYIRTPLVTLRARWHTASSYAQALKEAHQIKEIMRCDHGVTARLSEMVSDEPLYVGLTRDGGHGRNCYVVLVSDRSIDQWESTALVFGNLNDAQNYQAELDRQLDIIRNTLHSANMGSVWRQVNLVCAVEGEA